MHNKFTKQPEWQLKCKSTNFNNEKDFVGFYFGEIPNSQVYADKNEKGEFIKKLDDLTRLSCNLSRC